MESITIFVFAVMLVGVVGAVLYFALPNQWDEIQKLQSDLNKLYSNQLEKRAKEKGGE